MSKKDEVSFRMEIPNLEYKASDKKEILPVGDLTEKGNLDDLKYGLEGLSDINSHILIGSFLEQMCLLYSGNNEDAYTLFNLVCNKLSSVMFVHPTTKSEVFFQVRYQYRRALFGLIHHTWKEMKSLNHLPAAKGLIVPTAINDLMKDNKLNHPIHLAKYNSDFKELSLINHGGFGQVYVAENKFDNIKYAIKKIPMPMKLKNFHKSILELKREVDVFSVLNHPNIVRYYSSWLEHPDPLHVTDIQNQADKLITEAYITEVSTKNQICDQEEKAESESSFKVVFADSSTANVDWSFHKEDTGGNSKIKALNKSYSKPGSFLMSELEEEDIKKNSLVLYIQMQLCSSNLQSWLIERSKSFDFDSDVEYSRTAIKDFFIRSKVVFSQFLSALEYIHEKGVIHRDIATKNIFVSGDKPQVYLGDFGLSTSVRLPKKRDFLYQVGFNPNIDDDLTSGLGTPLYISPEQLGSTNYGVKSDMYSAGIILFELLWPMHSQHERISTILKLKNERVLPAKFEKMWPKVCPVVLLLTSKIPEERPSASDLLNNKLFCRCTSCSCSYYSQLLDCRTELQSAKQIIAELKEKLKKSEQ